MKKLELNQMESFNGGNDCAQTRAALAGIFGILAVIFPPVGLPLAVAAGVVGFDAASCPGDIRPTNPNQGGGSRGPR